MVIAEVREKRSALRGKEQRLFNAVFKEAKPQQRRRWLHVLLCCSVQSNDLGNCFALLKAGASPAGAEETERLSDVLLACSSDARRVLGADVLFKHDHLVETLIRKGARIDSFDTNGTPPLRLAIQHGCFSAAEALLAAGADFALRCSDDGCAALDVASVRGEVKIMALLTAAGADINAACGRGLTALHRAVHHHQQQAIDFLLEAGAVVDPEDRVGWTPVFDAVKGGSASAIASLLRHGANVGHLDKKKRGLVHLAAEHGDAGNVLVILQHGSVDINLRFGSSQCSPVDCAAIAGHADVLRVLIEGGADVNLPASDGRTALHRAAFFNQPTAIAELFRAGASLESRTTGGGGGGGWWTPLFDAAAEGSAEAVDALLEHGAACNIRDLHGRTPLHVAVEADHAEICSALLAAGADPSLRYGENELSALEAAIREGNSDIVVAIIRSWPDGLSSADSDGYTPLHYAAHVYEVPSIEALLRAGAAVDPRDRAGWTPLFDAVATGRADSVCALLAHGADAQVVDSWGRSPLHLAAQKGFVGPVWLLLTAGADGGRRCGKSQCCPLDLAVVEGHGEVVKAMADHGVDLNASDGFGRTAVHRACFFNQYETLAVLVVRGADVAAIDARGRTGLDVAAARGSREAAAVLSIHAALSAKHDRARASGDSNNCRESRCIPAGRSGSGKLTPAVVDCSPPTAAEEQTSPENEGVSLADQAWLRRGFLVLCRAHPDRLRRLGPEAMVVAGGEEGSARTRPLRVAPPGWRPCYGDGAGSAKTRPLRVAASGGWSDGGDGGSAKTRTMWGAFPRLCPHAAVGDNAASVAAQVVLLQEDGLFRDILGYL